MEDNFYKRLLDEKVSLEEKVEKLKIFLFTGAFNQLDFHQQGLLQIQLSAMETYLKCLNERLVLIKSK
jgi:hypothetical protein